MSTILKITRSIDNDIWKIIFSVDSAKFSETDKQLISKFGEPEINVGGVFLGPIAGEENEVYVSVGGNSTKSSGGAGGSGAVFTVTRDDAGAVSTVVLGTGVSVGGTGYSVGDRITILGTALGGEAPGDDLIVTVVSVDAANSDAVLTFTHAGGGELGTVENPNQFTLPDKYIKIRSGLPYVQEFDSRGNSGIFSNSTQIKAEAFQTAFVSRYTTALTALRNNVDGFTGEFLINI